METEKTNGTAGQVTINPAADPRAVQTLDALLATVKEGKDRKEILGNVGQGLVSRIKEAQKRLASAVLNGDFEGSRQLCRQLEEMNAFGWHLCKHPAAVAGLAEKLMTEIIEAFRTGKLEVGKVDLGSPPASRHGVSFF